MLCSLLEIKNNKCKATMARLPHLKKHLFSLKRHCYKIFRLWFSSSEEPSDSYPETGLNYGFKIADMFKF